MIPPRLPAARPPPAGISGGDKHGMWSDYRSGGHVPMVSDERKSAVLRRARTQYNVGKRDQGRRDHNSQLP